MKDFGMCPLSVFSTRQQRKELKRSGHHVQYVVLGPRKSPIPLVRVFSENDKIFCQEKNMLNNERYRDLLISILSYDEVSAFSLRVKT